MSKNDTAPKARDSSVYSVSQLNNEVRAVLVGAFPLLVVEGELSNFRRVGSGHWYFTLKDAHAQVSCAMFRNHNRHVRDLPKDGDAIRVRARVDMYLGRGQFQLIVEHVEPAGEGRLRRQFDELKNRLGRDGLFAAERKLALPGLPQRIAVVTSPEGAAVRDVLSVLNRRFAAVAVEIHGVRVQGADAAPQICTALERLSLRSSAKPDLILLVRGGGSLEDLWAFNEESVARAMSACPIPIISGVGHEIDFTIADFVADRRASTPSAAAELAVPNADELSVRVREQQARLHHLISQRLGGQQQRCQAAERRLRVQHPARRLQGLSQRLDELAAGLSKMARRALTLRQQRLAASVVRLRLSDPRRAMKFQRQRLRSLQHALLLAAPTRGIGVQQRALGGREATMRAAIRQMLERAHGRFRVSGARLNAVSPLAVLERGYAAVYDASGEVVTSVSGVQVGDPLHARLSDGLLDCEIRSVKRLSTEARRGGKPV